MTPNSFFLCTTLLTLSLTYHGISAITFEVVNEAPNHPGSARYANKIGVPYTKEVMGKATNFIWSVFEQNSPADRKPIDRVTLYIKDFKDTYKGVVALASGDKLNYSASALADYKDESAKQAFTVVMHHELTHIWQHDSASASGPLIEGIADFVVLKAKFLEGFAKPGEGDKWDQGYGFTARFLEYIDGLYPGFVAKLNKMMKEKYDVTFFKVLTGKPVEQLWKEYKAKYKA